MGVAIIPRALGTWKHGAVHGGTWARGLSITEERSVGSQDHGEAWMCVPDTRGGKALGLCAGKGMIRRWEGAAREVWREV